LSGKQLLETKVQAVIIAAITLAGVAKAQSRAQVYANLKHWAFWLVAEGHVQNSTDFNALL